LDGIFILDKPRGITSFGALKAIKKITGEPKIGHLGTLDPLASGVLPVFLGKMTKLISHFNGGDKAYLAQVQLGASSTTLDAEGELAPAPLPPLTREQVLAALPAFLGEISQVPPMFSAIKVQGKRLYQLARQGQEVERQARKVVIHSLTLKDFRPDALTLEVVCGKGTYIRSLADDLAQALGTRGYLTDLRRLWVEGGFDLDRAVSLDQIRNFKQIDLIGHFLDPRQLLSDWLQWEIQDEACLQRIRNGARVPLPSSAFVPADDGKACLIHQGGRLIGLGRLEFSQDVPMFQPEKLLA